MNQTTLRMLRPDDVPVVRELLRRQNERDGTCYGLPEIFDDAGKLLSRIPLALAAVDSETGEVLQAHVYEVTLEQMTFGTDPRATLCSMKQMGAVWFALQNLGYQDVHLQVPKVVVSALEKGLDSRLRMTRDDGELAHFYRLLDHAENERLRAWDQSRRAACAVPRLDDRSGEP